MGGAEDEFQGSRDGVGATPFILALGRLRQENLETEVSLDYKGEKTKKDRKRY